MKTTLKNNLGIVAVIIVQFFFFFSCESNPIRSKVVGVWESEFEITDRQDEDAVLKTLIKCVDIYHNNGTSNVQGTVSYILDFLNTEEGVRFLVEFKYNMSYEGKWEIEDGFIVENGTSVRIRLVDSDLTAYDTDDGEELFVDEELKREIIKEYTDVMEDEIYKLKKDILKQDKSQVVSVTESQMIQKSEDGELITYKRIE